MNDLLSTFPAGVPGVALLLLRLSAAIVLFAAATLIGPVPIWGCACLALCGAALALGFLARIVAVIAGIVAGFAAALGVGSACWLLALHALDAAALVLLGPGAYSIDARIFGRRVITFPS